MAAKLAVLALALATCHAVPVWINGNGLIPGMILRIGRSPNVAFGFGSGFSSNIGGIRHSSSIGSSFQSGDAEAYGEGLAGSNDGGAFARGVGIANAAPYPSPYQQSTVPAYNGGLARNSFGSAVSSAQNYGGNFGSAVSSAQTNNGLNFGSAVSSAQNAGPGRFQSAISSAQNLRGLGYESSVASANGGPGYGSALSSAQNSGFGGFNSAVSAAHNVGGYGGSTSHAVQQRAGSLQHSGASSINGPGLQAAHSHAVNSGYY